MGAPLASAANILPDLASPQALQGHDDENWPSSLVDAGGGPTNALRARYKALGAMQPGIRRYNMFWSAFESGCPSAHALPLSCPAGYLLTPANESERARLGYHRFHCYLEKQLRGFDTIFELDSSIGAQNAAILYSAPSWARHPNCTGFVFGKDRIKGGCAPPDDKMDDYEDFVSMLVLRYLQPAAHNHTSHRLRPNVPPPAPTCDSRLQRQQVRIAQTLRRLE
jgi:hypothetical protein